MKKLNKDQELQLLNKCLDCGKCEQLIIQYEKLVFNTIIRIGKKLSFHFSDQMIEDLSQDIFLELFVNNCKRLRAYQQSKGLSLASWIVLIATHTIYNQLKKKRYSDIFDEIDETHFIPEDIDNKLEARQKILLIKECLEQKEVGEFERIVFKFHHFMGFSLKVIAGLTDRKEATIHSDKSRALAKVKNCIESKEKIIIQ